MKGENIMQFIIDALKLVAKILSLDGKVPEFAWFNLVIAKLEGLMK